MGISRIRDQGIGGFRDIGFKISKFSKIFKMENLTVSKNMKKINFRKTLAHLWADRCSSLFLVVEFHR